MTVVLTGNLQKITGNPVDETTLVTVKSPVYSVASTGIVTSAPSHIPVSKDGSFTVSVVEGEKSFLYLEGGSWTDSIPFVAAAGQTDFIEAVINAIPTAAAVKDMLREMVRVGAATIQEIKGLLESTKDQINRGSGEKWVSAPDHYDTLLPGTAHSVVNAGVGAPNDWMGTVHTSYLVEGGGVRIQEFVGRDAQGRYHYRLRYFARGSWEDWKALEPDDTWHHTAPLGQVTTETANGQKSGAIHVNGLEASQMGLPFAGMGVLTTWRASGSQATQLWVGRIGPVAEMWTRSLTSSGWMDWLKIGSSKMSTGTTSTGSLAVQTLSADTNMPALPDGFYHAPNNSVAQALGLPQNLTGFLLQVGTSRQYTNARGVYVSAKTDAGWGVWNQAGVVDGYTPVTIPSKLPFYQEDTAESKDALIDQDHHGSAQYALNTQNWPTAGIAWCLHQYSNKTPAFILDNCRSQPSIQINNTQNKTITPDYKSDAPFFRLGPWDDAGNYTWWLELRNDLTWWNNTKRVMSIQAANYPSQDILRFKNQAGKIVATIDQNGNLKSPQIDELVRRIEALEAKGA